MKENKEVRLTKKNINFCIQHILVCSHQIVFNFPIKGGDTSRSFKKSKIFFLLKSIEKLFKNIIPKFYW